MNTLQQKRIRGLLASFILTLSFVSTNTALAQTPASVTVTPQKYTVLSPLPGTTDGNCIGRTDCTADLSTYLPGIFNLSIGIGAVSAFLMLTFFGFEYMLTDSLNTKVNAKKRLLDAVWGLGFVIFAYAILNTLNPALVAGNLNLVNPTIPTANVTTGSATLGVPCTACTAALSGPDYNLSVKPGTGIYASPTLAGKLKNVNDQLKSLGGITITEGNPPSYGHRDTCHTNGTCVDAKPAVESAASINAFGAAAKKSGLNATLEVSSSAMEKKYKDMGVTIPIEVNTLATGTYHFHVEL